MATTQRLRTRVMPDQADVLRVRRVREGVEDAAEDGGEAVGAQPVGERARLDLAVRHLADRDQVAGRLGHRHQRHDQHRDDRRADLEGGRPEVERRADADPAGVPDPDRSP